MEDKNRPGPSKDLILGGSNTRRTAFPLVQSLFINYKPIKHKERGVWGWIVLWLADEEVPECMGDLGVPNSSPILRDKTHPAC